ncbi:MAG: CAP domain-containing protein [Deltaproteobacteria bacterium]|nr:CAP domain-containing protein [Deltaproteobacteria bacterium]
MRGVASLAAALLVVSACPATRSPEDGAQLRRALAGIERVHLELRPSSAWASHYGASSSHRLSATEEAIAARLRGAGLPTDPALSQAMRELARLAPGHTNMPSALTDGLLAWAGVIDPAPRLVVVEFSEDPGGCWRAPSKACDEAIDDLVRGVRDATDRGAHAGVGVARTDRGATRMIVGVVERAVVLSPMVARIGSGGAIEVRGRLQGGRVRPAIDVTLPSGQARALGLARGGGEGDIATTLRCDAGDGVYQLEILADGEHGIEVVANFPLFCGVEPPAEIVAEVERLSPDVTATDVAIANLHFLNETRRARGLAALTWDERAAAVARAHSLDMQQHDFVGHVSPRTGDVGARFERAGIEAGLVRENVARGYGPAGIHDSLMRSPGHRANLLAADVTAVGIGVVIGPPESEAANAPRPVFLTQNFLRPPGAGAPASSAWVPTLQRRVAERRRAQGLAAAQWDDALDDVAARLAKLRAAGREPGNAWERDVFAHGHASVDAHAVVSSEYDALAGVELWRAPSLHAGIGIAKDRDGRFVMVVLVVVP